MGAGAINLAIALSPRLPGAGIYATEELAVEPPSLPTIVVLTTYQRLQPGPHANRLIIYDYLDALYLTRLCPGGDLSHQMKTVG